MRIGVLTFPGSNCDQDAVRVFTDFFQARTQLLWYREAIQEDFDLLIVPGGFSYGDYLRAGAIARFAPAMESLQAHARRGGVVVGICNGFQILCESHLLPGALIRNNSLLHICRNVNLRANPANRFAASLDDTRKYSLPISHGEGNFRIDPDDLKALQDNNQIVFRYEHRDNPNGSVDDIAGISDRSMRVLGMMPHPERAVDPLTGGTDGRPILESILAVTGSAVGG